VSRFKSLQSDDLGRVQDLIERAFDSVDGDALLAEHTVVNQVLRVTDTPVFHGLGRPARGWIVTRSNALATYAEITPSTNPSLFVNLRASATATVTLLFY
jgi:hypothetical protein